MTQLKLLNWIKAKDAIFGRNKVRTIKLNEEVDGNYAFYYFEKPMKLNDGYLSFEEKNLSEAKHFVREGFRILLEKKEVKQETDKVADGEKKINVIVNPDEQTLIAQIEESKDVYTDAYAIKFLDKYTDDAIEEYASVKVLKDITDPKMYDQEDDNLNDHFKDIVSDIMGTIMKEDPMIEDALGERYMTVHVKKSLKDHLTRKGFGKLAKYV